MLTAAQKRAIAQSLAAIGGTRDPKSWAHRLKALELTGHRLTQTQRQAWRDALRGTPETEELPAD